MKQGQVVLGVLAGLAAGAVLGILFAPDKGENTRKKILNKGEGYADDLKEKFDEFVETVTEKFETKKNEAEKVIAGVKSKFAEVNSEAKSMTV